MKKKRLTYLDISRGLAMVLVVIGHTFGDEAKASVWFYTFHIPLFFIISGCIIRLTNKKRVTFGELIKSRVLTLLVPYFIFAVPITLAQFANASFDTDVLVGGIGDTICLVSYSSLWFLPALFFAEVGFFLYRKIKSNSAKIIILCLNFGIPFLFDSEECFFLLWLLLRASVGMGFLIIGYYLFGQINKSENNIINFFVGILFILPTLVLCQLDVPPDLFSLRFGNPIIYLINGIFGSIGFILIFKVLDGKLRILQYCGQNSLIIMGTHELFLEFHEVILEAFDYETSVYIMLIVGLVVGEYIIITLINKYGAWPIGKKKGELYKTMYPNKVVSEK